MHCGAACPSVNKKQIAMNLLEVLGEAVKHEELIEGMEHEHEHEHHETRGRVRRARLAVASECRRDLPVLGRKTLGA